MGETSRWVWNSAGILVGSDEFWRESNVVHGRWATVFALLFIVIWQSVRWSLSSKRPRCSVSSSPDSTGATASPPPVVGDSGDSRSRISDIVTDADLQFLLSNLDGTFDEEEKWDDVIDKRNSFMLYYAKCCKPKNGPLKYLSVTVFENCTAEWLRDFYLDNEYRKQWDKIVVDHEQLQVDETTGTEIGRTIKKFPLLTPREYILAWRLLEGEGEGKTFYCFSKECEHAMAPRQKKYVRVGYFRSGWRIRKVPGRNACEIKLVHQEDAGLNVEMAKVAFARGIWSYVCKMDVALRKYSPISHPRSISVMTAVTLMQKVPPELASAIEMPLHTLQEEDRSAFDKQATEISGKKLHRRPSKKMIANGLLLLGGVLCLSRGHSSLGSKLAIACAINKFHKHGAASGQAAKN